MLLAHPEASQSPLKPSQPLSSSSSSIARRRHHLPPPSNSPQPLVHHPIPLSHNLASTLRISQASSSCLSPPQSAVSANSTTAALHHRRNHPRRGQATSEHLVPSLLSFPFPCGSVMLTDLMVLSGTHRSRGNDTSPPGSRRRFRL